MPKSKTRKELPPQAAPGLPIASAGSFRGTAGSPSGTPGSASGTPGSASGTPGSASGTPGSSSEAPRSASGTPGSASGTPGSAAEVPFSLRGSGPSSRGSGLPPAGILFNGRGSPALLHRRTAGSRLGTAASCGALRPFGAFASPPLRPGHSHECRYVLRSHSMSATRHVPSPRRDGILAVPVKKGFAVSFVAV